MKSNGAPPPHLLPEAADHEGAPANTENSVLERAAGPSRRGQLAAHLLLEASDHEGALQPLAQLGQVAVPAAKTVDHWQLKEQRRRSVSRSVADPIKNQDRWPHTGRLLLLPLRRQQTEAPADDWRQTCSTGRGTGKQRSKT